MSAIAGARQTGRGTRTKPGQLLYEDQRVLGIDELHPKNSVYATDPFYLEARMYLHNIAESWQKWSKSDVDTAIAFPGIGDFRCVMWEHFGVLRAAADNDEEAVVMAVLTAPTPETLSRQSPRTKTTALHIAARQMSAELCRMLVTKGARCSPDVNGDTPIHVAADAGRSNIIAQLCGDVKESDMKHACYELPRGVRILPDSNAAKANKCGWTPVHLAAKPHASPNHLSALRYLIRHAGVSINMGDTGVGNTPLHMAIARGDRECAKMCLRLGANKFKKNQLGSAPVDLVSQTTNHLGKLDPMAAILGGRGTA